MYVVEKNYGCIILYLQLFDFNILYIEEYDGVMLFYKVWIFYLNWCD